MAGGIADSIPPPAAPAHTVAVSMDRRKRLAFDRLGPEAAAIAIAELDPHALGELRMYLDALRRARDAESVSATEYLIDAITELFTRVDMTRAKSIDTVLATLAKEPGGAEAMAAHDQQRSSFRTRYFQLKALAKMTTQRAVARASGLSLTTVQAIEDDANTSVPQFRTLERLARGFNKHLPKDAHVSAADLRGC